MSNDPRKGEGWGGFLEDNDEVWFEAFETTESGELDVDAYDEFANVQELVNFVAGTGSYEDTRGFTPGQSDLVDKKREMKNDVWKIPEKLEEIDEYLEQGAMRGEIDINPNAAAKWNISKEEANQRGKDTKYTAHFLAYDKDDTEDEGGANFYIAASWYDTPPEEMNVEDIFDLESIVEKWKG